MKLKLTLVCVCFIVTNFTLHAQITDHQIDSLYIDHIENHRKPVKVLHAEPLYIDLIRDLGARKGEKEWNIGFGLTDKLNFDTHEALIEYEWAPIDRLGLEVELPFTFYAPINGTVKNQVPSNKLNSIKMASQWSFLVNERMATSMALGYIHEFELSDFSSFGKPIFTGSVYNPFLVMAKRWGNNLHSLIYTGPIIEKQYNRNVCHLKFDINSSFHYMITGTRNFIGIEFNKTLTSHDFDMTIRPQMRVAVSDNMLIGIVAGIPAARENERLSAFLRLIWEPPHKTH